MSSNVHMQALVRFVVEARTALRVDACLAWIRAAVAAAETHAAQAWRRDDVQAAVAVLLDADLLSLVSTVSLALALVALYFALRDAAPVRHPLDAHAPSDMATWDDRDGSGKRDIYASLKTYANSKASQRPSAAATALAGNPGSLNREFVQMPQLNMQQQQQQRYDPYSSGPYATAAGAPSSSSYLSSARGAGNGNGNGSSSSAAPYTPISASPAVSGYESDFTGSDYIASPSDDFFAYTGKKTMMVDALLKESTIDPSVLVGWHVDVHGRGRGLVKGIKKSFARPTKFIVHFENGSQKLLSLKRSDKKGKIPFTPISKM